MTYNPYQTNQAIADLARQQNAERSAELRERAALLDDINTRHGFDDAPDPHDGVPADVLDYLSEADTRDDTQYAPKVDAPAQQVSPSTYPLLEGNCCDDYRMLLDIAAERTECVVKTTGNETNVLDIYPPHEIQVRIPRDADTVFHIVRGNRPVGRHEVSFSLIMLPLGQGYGKIEGDANLMLAKYWVEAEPA